MTAEQERKNLATHTLFRAEDQDAPPSVKQGDLWLCRVCGAGETDLYLRPCTAPPAHTLQK
ncbi:MAG: hypothetical protein KDK75_13420 [Alphaproteobacteria bacterium]|nr:hypothetical protein [Alphaproteobacteria bacterium]